MNRQEKLIIIAKALAVHYGIPEPETEEYSGRVMAIAACMGYMAGFIFHQSLPMDIFVMVLYVYLVYTTWQKVKKVIIEEEKEDGKKNE